MEKIVIKTKQIKEIVDITDKINTLLKKHNVGKGLCHLFLPHSTAGLTTVFLNPNTELSVLDMFDDITIPKWKIPGHEAERKYEHTHYVIKTPDHIIASFLGSSCFIPVKDGKLLLGNFQRVVLVELNGPKEREILIDF
ncbi:MAG: secondary thiamine-phosphate synthase enzyme YjbQ [Patescibacteria group bacterium]|nr:secondary thiamine-phosphate synthase enzyme YjbQ [Patescibacteria group bacterium]